MKGRTNVGGGKPEEEKTVTAGTSVIEVLPSRGKTMKKVNVNPTPTEEKTITAGTSATTVTPTSGKYIKKVTVNPTPSQSKTVTPSTSQQTVSPDSGKLLSKVIVKAMEDVTPEVTAQTPVITQIAENLGVTITTPSGTNKQILQGNNANLLNIKNNANKSGLYVWKKLTAQDGDFIDYVVSDSPTAYPDGGEHGGYWYEKVSDGLTPQIFGYTKIAVDKIVCSANTTLYNGINHSLGEVPETVLLYTKATGLITGANSNCILSAYINKPDGGVLFGGAVSVYRKDIYEKATQRGTVIAGSATDTKVSITDNSTLFLKAGVEYILITMA